MPPTLTAAEFRAAMSSGYPGFDLSGIDDAALDAAIDLGRRIHSATSRGLLLASAHALALWHANASNPLGGGAASGAVSSVRVGDVQTSYDTDGGAGFGGGGGDRSEYLKRSVYGQMLLALEARRGVAAYAV